MKTSSSIALLLTFACVLPVTAQSEQDTNHDSVDQDRSTWSAFHAAIEQGDKDTVRRLIAEGANVRAREPNPWKRSLLHLAAASHSKHPKASRKIARMLVKAGADVNAEMRSGLTPLHETARSGSNAIAGLLISRGAKLNSRVSISNCLDPDYDLNGDTPLDVALATKQETVASLLRMHGGKTGSEMDHHARPPGDAGRLSQ